MRKFIILESRLRIPDKARTGAWILRETKLKLHSLSFDELMKWQAQLQFDTYKLLAIGNGEFSEALPHNMYHSSVPRHK